MPAATIKLTTQKLEITNPAITPLKGMLGYLGVPYTWDPEAAFWIVNRAAAILMVNGFNILSPISHSHPISEYIPDLQLDHDFWKKQDAPLMKACDFMFLLVLGDRGDKLIKESKGCQHEIRTMLSNNKPVYTIKIDTQ